MCPGPRVWMAVVVAALSVFACKREPPARRPADARPAPAPAARPEPPAPAPVAAPPTGAARWRTGRPEARAVDVPAPLRQGIAADPERFLAPLVRHLVEGQPDDLGRAKAIHDWIALNVRYDVEGFLGGRRAGTSWTDTLRSGVSVCEGYASVFERMCNAAGLECRKVGGYGRGYGYEVFDEGAKPDLGSHAWTAVHAGGGWHLVDVTWDAGHVEGRRFVPRYSTDHLFLEPSAFIYAHLPADPRWQLVEPPLSAAEFSRLPYLRGRFFAAGLVLRTPVDRVNDVDAEERLELEVPGDARLMAVLRDADGRELAGRVLVQAAGPYTEVRVRFPGAGRFRLDLFVARAGETRGEIVATLGYRAARGAGGGFPKTFKPFGDLRCRLEAPLEAPLRPGDRVRFRLAVPGARSVKLLTADRQWLPLARAPGDGDVFETTVAVPEGPVRVMTDDGDDGTQYTTLLEYGP